MRQAFLSPETLAVAQMAQTGPVERGRFIAVEHIDRASLLSAVVDGERTVELAPSIILTWRPLLDKDRPELG